MPGVTILTYHGVTDVESRGIENFQGKHVSAETFAHQVRYLREHERALRLSDLIDAYERGDDPDGVVVTFDDGYQNNYRVALPILERFEVPATFFFSTGFLGTDRMFWVDEVELAVDATGADRLDVTGWGLGVYPLATSAERMTAVTELKAHLKRVDDGLRESRVAELAESLPPRPGHTPSPNYRTLTWDEVRALARSPLVEIGAHTVDHPILTRIGGEALRCQVGDSKKALERETGRPVTQFAYPNGGPDDFDATVIHAVRAAGFRCGCTTLPGRNTADVSLFELRRTMVGFCGEPFPFPIGD